MLSLQTRSAASGDFYELIERVKAEVDCQLLIPDDGSREEFDRYVRQSCINPGHPDRTPTMLIFHDGANCSACGWKGDAVDIYRLWNPDASAMDAVQALLADTSLALTGEAQASGPRVQRQLDPDNAIRYHLALVQHPEAVAGLMKMGFTKEAIKHFRLGYAKVLARLQPDEHELAETLEDIEWREVRGQKVAYQWQWRFSVPIFVEGKLRQIIYRKSSDTQLGGKTTMEKDAGAHLFGQDELATADNVMVLEGWGDKIIWWQWGFRPENRWAVVTSTNGAGHWQQEWNELVGLAHKVYVGADADNAGSKMMERVKRDVSWAVPVAVPWPHGTKKDWRDGWLAGWQRAYVEKLLRQAKVAATWSYVAGGAK